MSLDPSVAGAQTEVMHHPYGWRELALYSLGIGATRDELALLYEGTPGGMHVLPSYAVVPAYPAVRQLLERAQVEPQALVHVGQRVVAHRAAPASGVMETTGELCEVADVKRFAQLRITTLTHVDGELLFDTEWTIVVRDAGGFGGPRPRRDAAPPRAPRHRPPDWCAEQSTHPEQALLYRLSGDSNPLHVEDGLARAAGFAEGAILHGLCTFGFVARAVVRAEAGADARRLQALSAQFRGPVWPGDAIETRGYRLDETTVALEAAVPGRDGLVITGAWAELAPA